MEKHKSVNKIGHGQYYISIYLYISFTLKLLVPLSFFLAALHELDPAFRKVTLENQRLKDLVTDLKFHKDPVGTWSSFVFAAATQFLYMMEIMNCSPPPPPPFP